MIIQTTNNFVILTAESGNVFRNKLTGDILTDKIYLGCNDIADNYDEVSEGEVYAESDTEGQVTEENE